MKQKFVTGLILLLPFAITFFIFKWVIDFLTDPFVEGMKVFLLKYFPHHPSLILFFSRIFVLIFLLVFIVLLGFLARKYFFNLLLKKLDQFFLKIPFVKTIYRVLKEIMKAMEVKKEKTFKGSVLVPFPSEEMHALGLVINELPVSIPEEKFYSVFVPTAPHPMSGFIFMVKESSVKPLELSTEEVFKILLSFGIVKPK